MTKTLSIDQTEWRVLFASNIQRVVEFVNAQPMNAMLTQEHLQSMHEHLDRAKLLATAWHRAAPPVKPTATAEVPAQFNQGSDQVNQANNGIKKRRGRPPKAEAAQVVQ